MFDHGIEVEFDPSHFEFRYGPGVNGPPTEVRHLDDIRASLLDPRASGPPRVYAIAMDVARIADRERLVKGELLLGLVAYSSGRVGREPVRSQGHVHAISPGSRVSPPELFEVWQGTAVIYMQERVHDDPGRCFAVKAGEGEHVIVPPSWPHMVVNADPDSNLVFGAICDRSYAGYVYRPIRERGGLAYFPVFERSGGIVWEPNPSYPASPRIIEKRPATYSRLSVELAVGPNTFPLYSDAVANPEKYRFVPHAEEYARAWVDFVP